MVALSLCTASGWADFRNPVALTRATVVTTSGETLQPATLLIDGARIVAVGTAVDLPPHAEILDGDGLTVYPGFIDAATHLGIATADPPDAERARFEDENPDVRDGPQSATVQANRRMIHPHWRAERWYAPSDVALETQRAAGFTVALISPRPAILGGRGTVLALGDAPRRRSILRADVAQLSAFVTATPQSPEQTQEIPRYPVTTMGAIAALRQILHDASWHRNLLEWCARHPDQDRPALDPDLEAVWPVLDGDMPVVFIANTENEINRALNLAAEFGIKPIIAGAREGWKVADRLAQAQVPVIVSPSWPDSPASKYKTPPKPDAPHRPQDDDSPDPRAELKLLFDDTWERKPFEPQRLVDERQRLWHEQVDNAKVLHEHGVRFAFGTFEMPSTEPFLKNLRTAIKGGLPEAAALAALTRSAAEILGIADLAGEIAPGRLANLTVLTGPLADPKSKVQWVFVDGQRFDVAEFKPDKAKERGLSDGATAAAPEAAAPEAAATEDDTPAESDGEPEGPVLLTEAPQFAVEIESDRKPAASTGGTVLLRRAQVLTISGADRVDTDILVRDGTIVDLGRGLQAPAGTRTIDLAGYFVMPGIIDPHSHMCTDGGLNESSGSVTCEVRIADVIDPHDPGAFRALAGGTTTIHTMHGSANAIGGQNAVLRLKYGRPAAEWLFAAAPRTVKFALGENVKQSNFGKKGSRFPNSRIGVEAVFRRSFDTAQQYTAERLAQAGATDPKPLRRDLRLDALAEVLRGDLWVHCHCYRADEILRLLATAEDYGFRIGVLQHVLEGYRIVPEMVRHGCGASTFSDWWAYKLEAYDAIPHNAARMFQGGVNATINSDSHELIRHLNLEAAKSLRYGGLEPGQALQLITINAAEQLGVERWIGSIEIGKRADLAVFDGHPLDTFSRCMLTLIDGEIYFQHPDLSGNPPQRPRPRRPLGGTRDLLRIPAAPNGPYWIRGATIHPISGPDIVDGVLAVDGPRLAWVGPAADRRPPAGAVVVNAEGLHVYPGLINAGTALGLTEIQSVAGSVDTSEIGSFQPDLQAVNGYNPFSSMIEVARSEGVTAALLHSGGSTISGQAGAVRMTGWSMPEALIDPAVGLSLALPTLPVTYPQVMTPEQKKQDAERIKAHRKRLREIEEFFRQARRYAQAAVPDALADRRLEAMVPYLRGTKPVLLRANSYKQILEGLEFCTRYGLRPIVYGGREAWKLADRLAEARVDVIITRSLTYPSDPFEPWNAIYRNAAVLAQAGVRFCFATGGASLAKNLPLEAGMAVAHGLDEGRALRALTLDAAAILNLQDTRGSLEPGKVADLIITTDTPLQASSRVLGAFIDGLPVDLDNKHTRMDRRFAARPQPQLSNPPELRGPPPLAEP